VLSPRGRETQAASSDRLFPDLAGRENKQGSTHVEAPADRFADAGSTPAASTEAPHDLAVVGGFVAGASEEAAGVRGRSEATGREQRRLKAPLQNPSGSCRAE
jgi:hypothetical protein